MCTVQRHTTRTPTRLRKLKPLKESCFKGTYLAPGRTRMRLVFILLTKIIISLTETIKAVGHMQREEVFKTQNFHGIDVKKKIHHGLESKLCLFFNLFQLPFEAW